MSVFAVNSTTSAPTASVADASAHRLDSASLAGLPPGLAHQPRAEQVKAVAGQFEAILLRQFLQESVGGMMGGASAGASGNVYGYLLTDILAGKLAEGGGLGLSKILQHQLTPRGSSRNEAAEKDMP